MTSCSYELIEQDQKDLLNLPLCKVINCFINCSTVWHSSLTKADCEDIERVQKAAVRLIMGNKYQGYKEALQYMKLESLRDRREKMALNFAKKNSKNGKFL